MSCLVLDAMGVIFKSADDVARWSDKLRKNLGIEKFLAGSIISGDVGVRKPDKEIYEVLIDSIDYGIEDVLFVDDREKNVIAARKAGIETIMFNPETVFADAKNWISQRIRSQTHGVR